MPGWGLSYHLFEAKQRIFQWVTAPQLSRSSNCAWTSPPSLNWKPTSVCELKLWLKYQSGYPQAAVRYLPSLPLASHYPFYHSVSCFLTGAWCHFRIFPQKDVTSSVMPPTSLVSVSCWLLAQTWHHSLQIWLEWQIIIVINQGGNGSPQRETGLGRNWGVDGKTLLVNYRVVNRNFLNSSFPSFSLKSLHLFLPIFLGMWTPKSTQFHFEQRELWRRDGQGVQFCRISELYSVHAQRQAASSQSFLPTY